jgi:uncharacterized protein DUF559
VKADFLWRDERLIVETDGRLAHGTSKAFEHDRQRDRRLVLAGYRVIRFTWKQITHDPHEVVETVSALLAKSPSPSKTNRPYPGGGPSSGPCWIRCHEHDARPEPGLATQRGDTPPGLHGGARLAQPLTEEGCALV